MEEKTGRAGGGGPLALPVGGEQDSAELDC